MIASQQQQHQQQQQQQNSMMVRRVLVLHLALILVHALLAQHLQHDCRSAAAPAAAATRTAWW
jgi:cell division protein FtsB